MAEISIIWRSYSFALPPTFDEATFWALKEELLTNDAVLSPPLKILEEFKIYIVGMGIGGIASFISLNEPNNSTTGTITGLIGFIGLSFLIPFIPSFYSYWNNHIEQKKYYDHLKISAAGSPDYNSFCKMLSQVDFRYAKLID